MVWNQKLTIFMNSFQMFTLIWILLRLLKLHISDVFFNTNVSLIVHQEFYIPLNSSKGGGTSFL